MVYVFKDDPDKGYDGNEEGAKGQGAYVVEDTAETSKDRSCWVTFFEVPERGWRTDPEGLDSWEKVDDPEKAEEVDDNEPAISCIPVDHGKRSAINGVNFFLAGGKEEEGHWDPEGNKEQLHNGDIDGDEEGPAATPDKISSGFDDPDGNCNLSLHAADQEESDGENR